MQSGKDLRRPVQGIDIPAVAFHVYPDLTAGTKLRCLDSRDDLLLLRLVEQGLARKEGDRHIILYRNECRVRFRYRGQIYNRAFRGIRRFLRKYCWERS